MQEGQSSTLRFLPDGDDTNTFFWKERLMIKLPFAGVKGETDSRPVQVQIPCMEMYGQTCDIQMKYVVGLKIPSLEDMGLASIGRNVPCIPRFCNGKCTE